MEVSFEEVKLIRFYADEGSLFFFVRLDLTAAPRFFNIEKPSEGRNTTSRVNHSEEVWPHRKEIGGARSLLLTFWTRAATTEDFFRLMAPLCPNYQALEDDGAEAQYDVPFRLDPADSGAYFCSNCEDESSLAGVYCRQCKLAFCQERDYVYHRSREAVFRQRQLVTPQRVNSIKRRADYPGCNCSGGDRPAHMRASGTKACECARERLYCSPDVCSCSGCCNPFNH